MLVRSLSSLVLLSGFLAPQQIDRSARLAERDAFEGPTYTANKQLTFPSRYREWVYLGSGVDMSYNPKEQASDHSMFNTVFVNPASYHDFVTTGI